MVGWRSAACESVSIGVVAAAAAAAMVVVGVVVLCMCGVCVWYVWCVWMCLVYVCARACYADLLCMQSSFLVIYSACSNTAFSGWGGMWNVDHGWPLPLLPNAGGLHPLETLDPNASTLSRAIHHNDWRLSNRPQW